MAVLTRIFGVHNLELAEDVMQDTLLKACSQWAYSGIPKNPSAWLFSAAKNKALDTIRRKKYEQQYAADIAPLLRSEYTAASTIDSLFLESEIRDDQLRMMFACCHPALPPEAQVALTLKTLCGFSAAEIARAFLAGEDTINKRLYRGREKLRDLRSSFEIPAGADLSPRLAYVLASIYLLFNEGYSATQHDQHIRHDLINEAIRLARLLIEHPVTNQPEVRALLALMLLHHARTPARLDAQGEIILLQHQDRSRWNQNQIAQATELLEDAAEGLVLSVYHVEAAIAWNHAIATDWESTNWEVIVRLYTILFEQQASPVVALNRAIAIAQLNGPQTGLDALLAIANKQALEGFYLYHATLGDFYLRLDRKFEAHEALTRATTLTHSPAETKLLRKKMEACQ